MSTVKPLLMLQDDLLLQLHLNKPETGMGFYVAGASGHDLYAVLSDGAALPLQPDHTFFDATDLAGGLPVPRTTRQGRVPLGNTFASRAAAGNALAALGISPHYAGGMGAFPLVAQSTLAQAAVFHRYLRTPVDQRYASGVLSAHTYLTTSLDARYANSGFAAVGRFALPFPLPASFVIDYELPAGTDIEIGTAMPLFGQAGGGVEIRLPKPQVATLVGRSNVPDY